MEDLTHLTSTCGNENFPFECGNIFRTEANQPVYDKPGGISLTFVLTPDKIQGRWLLPEHKPN
jgi:hypothetical protein